jgi:kynureninase
MARQWDKADELASFRDAFVIREPDLIYLDGNSLGRLPRRSVERMELVTQQQWGEQLIRGWRGAGWMEAPYRIGDKIGQLLGAGPGQVVVTDCTSVNLFKLAMAALALRPGRTRIISDEFNFPTDVYVFQGCASLLGNRHTLQLLPSEDGIHMDLEQVLRAIDQDTALVSFSHPAFKSCFAYEVQAITEHAHKVGALVLWDLSHGVGAVPVRLDEWGVDFAAGCSYKYLNGGPGAPAWLYVREELQDEALSPIWGWFSHRAPFVFDLDYAPAEGIPRFRVGTPHVLSMAALEPAVDLVLEAGMERIRQKSLRLGSLVVELLDSVLAPLGFWLGSPRDPEQRGAHVLVCHQAAFQINRTLVEEMGVIADFRPPNGIRLGLSPLYTTFAEAWEAVQRLRRVVEEERHLKYPVEQQAEN